MKEEVKIFKALGDETRFKILILLSSRNICAKGIARQLGISEAAVSQHIKVLKEAELIIAYKKGYFVMYELNLKALEKAIGLINTLTKGDFNLISDEYKLNTTCKSNCKSIKGCCKKIFEEE